MKNYRVDFFGELIRFGKHRKGISAVYTISAHLHESKSYGSHATMCVRLLDSGSEREIYFYSEKRGDVIFFDKSE